MTRYIKRSDFGPDSDPGVLHKKLEIEFKAIERALSKLQTGTTTIVSATSGSSGGSSSTTTTVESGFPRIFMMMGA